MSPNGIIRGFLWSIMRKLFVLWQTDEERGMGILAQPLVTRPTELTVNCNYCSQHRLRAEFP